MKIIPMKTLAASLLATAIASTSFAAEGPIPQGIPHLDHVYLIVMENHGYSQIVGNPNMPWTNHWIRTANLGTKYFAVAHPSLTNYLEIVGGSNFGVLNDNGPDWHNRACLPNLVTGLASTDNPYVSAAICPIAGIGTEAATPAIDTTNETQGAPGDANIDGNTSIPAATNISGKTIADQLVSRGKRWKSYQESLSPRGANRVDYSDGVYDNLTDFSAITPQLTPPLSQANVVKLYASKHNPFVYFSNVQAGANPNNNLDNSVGFDGAYGLYSDLRTAGGPALSFIAPNQCNDQHGRGNGGPFCNYDPSDVGTQAGLNPALIHYGDVTLQKLVTAIKAAPSWNVGHNAIVVVWDENDYSQLPNTNQVPLIVETNYSTGGVRSNHFYTHYSLLKTLEAGLGLPCLNHACDSNAYVMSDLFN